TQMQPRRSRRSTGQAPCANSVQFDATRRYPRAFPRPRLAARFRAAYRGTRYHHAVKFTKVRRKHSAKFQWNSARRECSSVSVRRRNVSAAVGADLGGHQALRAGAVAHEHELPRAQLREAVAAQGFHVHEDVRRALAAREVAETAK